MRMRALAIATAAGLVLAVAPATAADAARKPTYKVAIKINTVNPSAGSSIRVSGKVAGPKAAKKVLLVQRKLGSGQWRTVKKVRTTKKRTYATKVKVSLAGKQYVRVIAPKSSKAKRGISRPRAYTGWRWLDLTKQRSQPAGEVVRGAATIAGRSYPRTLTFPGSGVYFNVDRRCTTFKTGVGVKDGSGDATVSLIALASATQDLSGEPTSALGNAAAGKAPTTLRLALRGARTLAFGSDSGTPTAVSPQALCSMNSLPSVPAL